jgi:cupin fold WbuC family metalloprotein
MNKVIPELSNDEKIHHFILANRSVRERDPKILHEKGDYLNKVFNFVLADSYMQPHLHPGEEKIENMYLIEGSFALIIFDNNGRITETVVLEKGEKEFIAVPAFTWHTYIMLTDEVIIYETMDGIYDQYTWKKLAKWAPEENSKESLNYLKILKEHINLIRYS